MALTTSTIMLNYLKEMNWLAKNIIWLIPDAHCHFIHSTNMWLNKYYSIKVLFKF